MSKYVTCEKCKKRYLEAEDVGEDEDGWCERHECPGTAEERLAALEKRVAKLERQTASSRWRA